jgi:predicted Zn-dependent peptidase
VAYIGEVLLFLGYLGLTIEHVIIEEKLSNGVRVVFEPMPTRRVASLGLWVRAGSRDEQENVQGCSHLIEHMAFKGTKRRSAEQISTTIEERGGYLNAFTDRDLTCFTAQTLQEDAEHAIDVLSDMIQAPLFQEEDLKREKQVVLEEISRRDDNPENLIEDLSNEAVWKGSQEAHSILGTRESIIKVSRAQLVAYHQNFYTPNNIIVTATGGIEPSNLLEALDNCLIDDRIGHAQSRKKPVFQRTARFHERDSSQVQLSIASEGLAFGDRKRYALSLLNSYLGVGSSSQLFLKVREKEGLVYSIYTDDKSMEDCGLYRIFAGTNVLNVEKVFDIILKELERLRSVGLTAEELKKNKQKMRGMLGLSFESARTRMYHLGMSTLRLGRPQTFEEIIENMEKVTLDEVNDLAAEIFDGRGLSFIAMGLPHEVAERLKENLF